MDNVQHCHEIEMGAELHEVRHPVVGQSVFHHSGQRSRRLERRVVPTMVYRDEVRATFRGTLETRINLANYAEASAVVDADFPWVICEIAPPSLSHSLSTREWDRERLKGDKIILIII